MDAGISDMEPQLEAGARVHEATPTLAQARSILQSYTQSDVQVSSVEVLHAHGFSAFTDNRSFVITVRGDDPPQGESYILRTSPASISSPASSTTPAISGIYAPNSLSDEYRLLAALPSSIPHATPLKLDTSCSLVPVTYLLLSHTGGIPLAEAKRLGTISERQRVLLDVRLGSYFKLLHETVQNDWFGLPSQEKDEIYGWQEAFTSLLEDLLREVQDLGVDVELPFEDVRWCLSRAIGSFMFDDVEVPSLVSFTGDEHSIFISVPTDPEEEPQVTSLLPFAHALWGDPLLEAAFMTDGDVTPSAAFLEGYGGSPIVFARQKTKRLWYTFFLALSIIVITARKAELSGDDQGTTAEESSRISWARGALARCIEKLKVAPCY